MACMAAKGPTMTAVAEPARTAIDAEVDAFLRWGRQARGWHDETIRVYASYVRKALDWADGQGGQPLAAMRRRDLRRFLDEAVYDSIDVRCLARKAVRAYFDRLIDLEDRDDNPADRIEVPRPKAGLPKALSTADAAWLAAAADAAGGSPRAALLLFLYAGLRISEARLLRWDHIDAASGWLTVVGKGDRTRTLPIHDRLAAGLRDAQHHADAVASPWVHPSPTDPAQPMCDSTLRKHVYRVAGGIGLDRFTPHTGRHTYATQLLEATGDLALVQEALGHASPVTTRVYTQVRSERLAGAVTALDYGTAR